MANTFPFQENRIIKDKLLFCFHHAGGQASVYKNFIGKSETFSVIPVELPGKAVRMNEEFIEDMDLLSDVLAKDIFDFANGKKIYLFGHSMGAIIAFLVLCKLEDKYGLDVKALAVAGRQPPDCPSVDQYRSDMGLDVLLQEMIRIDGAPDYLVESKELQEFVLPMIRRDYKLNESFQYKGEVAKCPIFAYSGTEDFDAPLEVMSGWERFTLGSFCSKNISGNHFFVTENTEFWEILLNDLETLEICV
ncbi:MAG: thioesterase [Parasporobacterium sp.]|nr:thioesterase [Parasporobacterium sp.]